MQRIKVIPHGIYAAYPAIEIVAENAHDAIEGWSRQAGITGEPLRMDAVGFDTEDELRAPTEATEIHLMPTMFGGGGKFGQILIGAAMIGLSFTGVGTLVAGMRAALIIGGAMSILTGVAGFFMKSPSLSKEDDPEASKYIGAGKNSTAIGTLIGIGGGRMLVAGQIMSLQVNSSDLVFGTFPESVPA